jgi:hypothetical protein
MRESKIERHLVRCAKKRGGEVRKVKWIGRHSAPDRAVFLPSGCLYWVELKAPGKKPNPNQVREHKRLWRMGQRVVVLDTIEKIDNFFKGIV